MNPYDRFREVTNQISIIMASAIVWLISEIENTFRFSNLKTLSNNTLSVDHIENKNFIAGFFEIASTQWQSILASFLLSIFLIMFLWIILYQFIMPRIISVPLIRKGILGRYYIEGTWIEAVRLPSKHPDRGLAIIDFQPYKDTFFLSGRTINQRGEVMSQFTAEFQKLDWPVLKYKHYHNKFRDSTYSKDAKNVDAMTAREYEDMTTQERTQSFEKSHGSLGEGVARFQFESNRRPPYRFDGFFVKAENEYVGIEAIKLDNQTVRKLRGPSQTERMNVLQRYWSEFFDDGFLGTTENASRETSTDAAPSE